MSTQEPTAPGQGPAPPRVRKISKSVKATAGATSAGAIGFTIIEILQHLDSRWIPYIAGVFVFLVLVALLLIYLYAPPSSRAPETLPPTATSTREPDPFAALETATRERRQHANANLAIGTLVVIAYSPAIRNLSTSIQSLSWLSYLSLYGVMLIAGFFFYQYFRLRAELRSLDEQRIQAHLLFRTLELIDKHDEEHRSEILDRILALSAKEHYIPRRPK